MCTAEKEIDNFIPVRCPVCGRTFGEISVVGVGRLVIRKRCRGCKKYRTVAIDLAPTGARLSATG